MINMTSNEADFKMLGVPERVKVKLDKLKIIPQEPYYSVIERLINYYDYYDTNETQN